MSIDSQNETLLLSMIRAAGMRGQVIANNIANQNTPGYRRQVLQFEELLETAMAKGQPLESVRPQITDDYATPIGVDGNNVTLELETGAARENRVLMETYLTLLQGHFRMLETAVAGGR